MLTEQVICPVCQAATARGQACWLCHAKLAGVAWQDADEFSQVPVLATLVNPYAAPISLQETEQASVPMIVLIVGLVIVIAALAFVAPGLAVLIGVLVAPALIRTAILVRRKKNAGLRVAPGERSLVFLASVAGVVCACITAVSAFLIACTASCFGILAIGKGTGGQSTDQLFSVMLIGSALMGLMAGVFLLWMLWRRK